jgi:hypothetical protein
MSQRKRPILALVEDDLEAAEEQRDQSESDPIDLQPAGQTLFPLFFQNRRFGDQPMHKEKRDDADGDTEKTSRGETWAGRSDPLQGSQSCSSHAGIAVAAL